jgi:hypothetical protein
MPDIQEAMGADIMAMIPAAITKKPFFQFPHKFPTFPPYHGAMKIVVTGNQRHTVLSSSDRFYLLLPRGCYVIVALFVFFAFFRYSA